MSKYVFPNNRSYRKIQKVLQNMSARNYATLGITKYVQILARRTPARKAGFSQIKKIPYQVPPTQLGPRKCIFWKNTF